MLRILLLLQMSCFNLYKNSVETNLMIYISCNGGFLYNDDMPSEDGLLRTETCKGVYKHINII
jgi:hypothetical protein